MNINMIYTLTTGTTITPVGTTKPTYSRQKKGWVTDIGIFSTNDPNEYVVKGIVAEPPAAVTGQ